MSADNVTPIRAGSKARASPTSPAKKRPRRTRYERIEGALVLEEFPAKDGMRVYHVLAGLRGVCEALDESNLDSTDRGERDLQIRLIMAARSLSSLLHSREADSCGPYRVLREVPVEPKDGNLS